MDQLRALSVRQPWAHSIVHHGKDVENRSRRLGHRGWTLIHASAGISTGEYADAEAFMRSRNLPPPPPIGQLRRGGIVGIGRVLDSIDASDPRAETPWWMGPCALVLADVRSLPFIDCKGTVAPLFWTPDAATLDRLRPILQRLALPELQT